MIQIEKTVEYKVWYKLNEEYTGNFQKDKLSRPGLHGTFGPESGGFERAQQEAANCKAWFNHEKKAVERLDARGKKVVDEKVTFHDNVVVWIEKYIDGIPVDEEIQCEEKEPEKPKRKKAAPVQEEELAGV